MHSLRKLSTTVSFPILKSSFVDLKHTPSLKISLLKAPSHFGHYSNRMMRRYNEDRYAVNFIDIPVELNDYGMDSVIRTQTCFISSIFDGHGGETCANYLVDNLHERIEIVKKFQTEDFDKLLKEYYDKIGGYWKRIYKKRESYYKTLQMRNKHHDYYVNDDLKLRLTKACLELDLEFLSQNKESGSTCTSILIYNLNVRDNKTLYFEPGVISKLTVSQIGDTKAIICDKEGQAHQLSSIHHPTSQMESQRLNKFSSGFMTDSFGENRFLNFANTRSFGDLMGKSKGISAEPDIKTYIIGDRQEIIKNNLLDQTIGGKGGDECFLVLVTDGVTNYATNQEIIDLIMSTNNNKGEKDGSPQKGAEEVVKYIEAIGGDDNATCLVIKLSNWGKWPIKDRTGKLREDKLKQGISKMERR